MRVYGRHCAQVIFTVKQSLQERQQDSGKNDFERHLRLFVLTNQRDNVLGDELFDMLGAYNSFIWTVAHIENGQLEVW